MTASNFSAVLADCIEARTETALDLYAKAHAALAKACDALEALLDERTHNNVDACLEDASMCLRMFERDVALEFAPFDEATEPGHITINGADVPTKEFL